MSHITALILLSFEVMHPPALSSAHTSLSPSPPYPGRLSPPSWTSAGVLLPGGTFLPFFSAFSLAASVVVTLLWAVVRSHPGAWVVQDVLVSSWA